MTINKLRKFEIVRYGFETITPERAKQILSNNAGNRNFKQNRVSEYAAYMRKGTWREESGDPIRLSVDGNLIDGQHRLKAVVTSGRSLRFMIYYCEPSDGLGSLTAKGAILDLGSRRGMGDITGLKPVYASISSCLIRDVAINGKTLVSDPEAVLSVYLDLEKSILAVCDKCSNSQRFFSQVPIKSIIVLRHAEGYDYTEEYRNVLNEKWNLLPNRWASWIRKISDLQTGKDTFKRREIMAYTWSVTSPDKDQDKNMCIKNQDLYFDEIRKSLYGFCAASLTRG